MKLWLLIMMAALLAASCNQGIKADKLYGEWNYTRIDHPRSDDQTDTLGRDDLAATHAHIKFIPENKLEIWWEGKLLSHGTFKTQGNNIQFTEQLTGGKTRTFPFYISRLDAKNIVFETMGTDGSRVTAVRK
jgi:hypothetical protein